MCVELRKQEVHAEIQNYSREKKWEAIKKFVNVIHEKQYEAMHRFHLIQSNATSVLKLLLPNTL